jgi:hypothetical protein
MELQMSAAYLTRSIVISVIIITLYPDDGTSQNEDQLTAGSTAFYDIQTNETEIPEMWNASGEFTTVPPGYGSSATTLGESETSWEAERFPNPLIRPHQCGMKKRQFVCDPDHVLNALEGKAKMLSLVLLFCYCRFLCGSCSPDFTVSFEYID